jgi:hypothetical protein
LELLEYEEMQLSDFEPYDDDQMEISEELRIRYDDYINTEEDDYDLGVKFGRYVNCYGIYRVLKQYFGPPTGVYDDPHIYFYELRSKLSGCRYQVFYRIEFWPEVDPADIMMRIDGEGSRAIFLNEARELKRLLEKEAARISINEEMKTRLYTFQNTFHAYFKHARTLIEPTPNTSLHLATAFFLLVASFEGFLNLIYELYLEPSLREDVRARDHVNRLPIDLKLRLAPLYCTCFKDKVLPVGESFGRWQAVTNLRNNLIHANLSASMTLRVK